MINDLLIFSVLWMIQLLIFACVGTLVFAELPEYEDFYKTLVLLLETSMGEWDLSIYENLSLGFVTGQLFHLSVLILNLILMLNLVVAILSETYSRFSKVKLGLYYDGVVE